MKACWILVACVLVAGCGTSRPPARVEPVADGQSGIYGFALRVGGETVDTVKDHPWISTVIAAVGTWFAVGDPQEDVKNLFGINDHKDSPPAPPTTTQPPQNTSATINQRGDIYLNGYPQFSYRADPDGSMFVSGGPP